MGSQIDTEVRGSVASVTSVAHWLQDSLKPKLDEAATQAVNARRRGQDDWLGHSGEAYTRIARDVVQVTDNEIERVTRAAREIEAYARRLKLCQERMADARSEAANGGLTVTGTVIQPPSDLSDSIKVTLYNHILANVNQELESFTDWIATNLTPVTAESEDPDADRLRETLLELGTKFGIASSIDFSKDKFKEKTKKLERTRDELKRWRRSGNPARRAANRAAEEAGTLEKLGKFAKWFGRAGKALGVVGTVIEAGEALESDHPVGGLLAAGLGIAATAFVGGVVVAALPVEVPALAAVAGAAAVGVGASYVADKVWEALPDSWTEPADHAVKHVVDEAEDKIEDGWHKVTGWI